MYQTNFNKLTIFLDIHNGTKLPRIEVEVEVEIEADWSETLESTSIK
jgi:hypothetical protein